MFRSAAGSVPPNHSPEDAPSVSLSPAVGGMGAWEWNLLTDKVTRSDSCAGLFGVSPG